MPTEDADIVHVVLIIFIANSGSVITQGVNIGQVVSIGTTITGIALTGTTTTGAAAGVK